MADKMPKRQVTTAHEFDVVMNAMRSAYAVLSAYDLNDLIAASHKAEEIGRQANPLLYLEKANSMREDRELMLAARAYVVAVDAMLAKSARKRGFDA